MNIKSLQQSVSKTVKEQGERLMRFSPKLIAISLSSAALVPIVLESISGAGAGPSGGMALLYDLGVSALTEFISELVASLQKKYGKEKPKEQEIQELLEKGLSEAWDADSGKDNFLREAISVLLQSIQGIDVALNAASDEIKQSLAQGLGELGSEFNEFRWILDELKTMLLEIQLSQTIQLATQKEQLELQREQLVKTNVLLQLQKRKKENTTPDNSLADSDEDIPPADVPCPYKGLSAYQPEDADHFFGRGKLVSELIARLAGSRFLGVIGPSGSGKSSVVRAGLIPAIWKAEIPGSKNWKTLIFSPGQHPLEELAARISLMQGVSPASLLQDIEKDPGNINLAVRQAFIDKPDNARLVIFIDQFEEVFTLCKDEQERKSFINVLVSAANSTNNQIAVIVALRADHYGNCSPYPGLSSLLSDNQILVGAMNEDELRRAITLPAEDVGLHLEPGLLEMIIREVATEPGALPLLSHALMETWERRSGYKLTVQGYLDSGGISGAIAETAENVYQDLSTEKQSLARNIFLRLTELGEGYEPSSRRTTLNELTPTENKKAEIQEVIKVLVDARLVVTEEETTEVAHEAIFSHWPTLRKWLEEDLDSIRIHQKLTESAQEWDRMQRDASLLYRGTRLSQIGDWTSAHQHEINLLESEFIKTSQSIHRRNRIALISSVTLIIVFLITAAVIFQNNAKNYALLAAENHDIASTNEAVALTAQSDVNARATAEAEAVEFSRELEVSLDKLESNFLASIALNEIDNQQDLGILLSIEAYRRGTSYFTLNSLLKGVQVSPELSKYLQGHNDLVSSVAFSPDGKILASGSWDDTIRLWDVSSGQQFNLPFIGHSWDVSAISFSPNGQLLASGSWDKTIRLWDMIEGVQIGEPFVGHTGWVLSVTFSPDGKILASGSEDNTIRFWDIDTGEQVGNPLAGHTDRVTSIAYSPDGSILASAGWDNTLRLWDTETGVQIGEALIGHTYFINEVSFSPNGDVLASTSYDGTIRFWNISTGQQISQINEIYGDSFAFSPDGEIIASGKSDNTIILWDITTDQQIGDTLVGHTNIINTLAFSPDGKLLASGSDDNKIIIWNLVDGQYIGEQFTYQNSAVDLVAFREEDKELISFSQDGLVQIWGITNKNNLLNIYNNYSRKFHGTFPVAISLDGNILATATISNTIELRNLTDGSLYDFHLVGHEDIIMTLAFSPDNSNLVSIDYAGTIIIWDLATGQRIREVIDGHPYGAHVIAFSPDGKTFTSGGSDNRIRFWDLETGTEIGEPIIPDINYGVNALAFNSDGSLLASAGTANVIRLWDVESREEVREPLIGHYGVINVIAFSPDDNILASGGEDNTLRLWDIDTGQQIGDPLHFHTSHIHSLAFSLDGKTLVSAGWDRKIILWDIDPDSWVEISCLRAGRNFSEAEWNTYFPEEDYQITCAQWPDGN